MPSVLSYLIKSISIGLLIAVFLLIFFPPLRNNHELPFAEQIETYSRQVESYSSAVRRAAPAVVNIYSQDYQRSNINSQPELRPTGLGSGIIMSDKGYILTNMHVVEKADQVLVALQDGRLLTAQMIGSDAITDLAVLQIEAENLPVIPQNPTYSPKVGDVVLAIGNPYNIGQTVTQGIISATGRTGISSTGRQDFLQTDAAINRGNSGGALINSRGEMVGINTSAFHVTQTLDSYGISFAVPYLLAERIMDNLIRDGRVIRGSIGVIGGPVNPLMAKLWGLEAQKGIMITGVMDGGPASLAGVKASDVMLAINQMPVTGVTDVLDRVAEVRPGEEVKVKLLREGKEIELAIEVADYDELQLKE
ncbi:outer membrane-stress sensor serine endopeptidase DegS [Motilimonas cestriensis]|uniref:Outer membrane-stress sensor serine endopeptidase DegS n=1 Tax=Motilimonas cestriensis TaxID=2742685 RepID=A0ABS8WET6_9GAMM|nr:outer membrane-stress sensor serine endopeptidase DegS [Motilimonas cestriensis]MCE2596074.1 outer membrane-stress sensor serine endopeptidase DegS [Motilimonas cestriensis]